MECCGRGQDAPLSSLLPLVHATVESYPRRNVVSSGQGPSFESEGAKICSLKNDFCSRHSAEHISTLVNTVIEVPGPSWEEGRHRACLKLRRVNSLTAFLQPILCCNERPFKTPSYIRRVTILKFQPSVVALTLRQTRENTFWKYLHVNENNKGKYNILIV